MKVELDGGDEERFKFSSVCFHFLSFHTSLRRPEGKLLKCLEKRSEDVWSGRLQLHTLTTKGPEGLSRAGEQRGFGTEIQVKNRVHALSIFSVYINQYCKVFLGQ